VLDETRCEPHLFRQLRSEKIPCHRLLHDGDTCFLLDYFRSGTAERYVQVSPKLLSLEKIVLLCWKCHAVAWHHGLYVIWRQACQWFGFAVRLCSWSCMLAPQKSMQTDLDAARSPLSWWSVLYLSFLFAMLWSSSFSLFIRTGPSADYFSEHFFGDTKCTKPRPTLKTSLCCAFYWESHDHTFDLLCFNM
jgi:hypothetical protein